MPVLGLVSDTHVPRRCDALPPGLIEALRCVDLALLVAVLGPWHIPLVDEVDGVVVVNPGAIGTPNATTRQLRQVVARLHLEAGLAPRVEHVDIADPTRVFAPGVDTAGGFRAAYAGF